ncbi:MAG: FAD-dependent oxidoreductase, partial [Planctomycetes bacterium]|nr:FAD-dependent oxidoreductase [Planctomycetota bacterium]
MTDLTKAYDVAIFGGGLCGYAAAMKLAGAGRRVILVERRPVLGWEATWACQLALAESTSPTATALRSELARVGGLRGDRTDAPILEMVFDRQAKQAGVDVLLYSQPVAVSVDDGRVASVTIASKAGELAVRATAFVDATENAFLWQRTGGIGKPMHSKGDTGATHVLFLNCVQPSLSLPLRLGDVGGVKNVVLQPTVWDGEVAVEFDIASPDIRIARRALPGLLEAVRKQFPAETAKAVVTNVGVEPFPRAAAQASEGHKHPKLKNLFGAGPWAGRGDAATLAGRLAMGEAAATTIGKSLGRLKPPSGAHVSAPSVAAPPAYDCDVLVCGGGTAGPFAAIAAARQGAKVMLIEPT